MGDLADYAEQVVGGAFAELTGVSSRDVYNTAADYEYFAEACVPVLGEWARAVREQRAP
ncbi:hypothetical protein ACF082_23455 [Streptomyces lydicus]|uniref:hypothetical protein n=1 Tax=Streptomyces lydicus TaxID=47763 RepID=UPI0036FCF7A0